jgi:[acyl-carrier-protein] S-malonyltransferase
MEGIDLACEKLKEAGAKRALPLKVGGAFHSPLMQPAAEELQAAIDQTTFVEPICPIYQNVDAKPHTDPQIIKANLIAQLTAPVRWTQMVKNMLADASTGSATEIEFTELGPGNVLAGLVAKIK